MRIIAHLDMDAFFAAVAEHDHEWLRGLPIVIGADPMEGRGRGVVSTANYKAREYGIRSAMPITKAWQLSEAARKQGRTPATFLGTDFGRYSEISDRIISLIRALPAGRQGIVVEQASIDEAYFDLSYAGSFADARAIAEGIKAAIKKQEGLTASVGIGPNKLVAKIASDRQKPDGLTVVPPEEVEGFLEPLPVRTIPGIGPKTEAELLKLKVAKVGDIKKFSEEELRELMGKWGLDLYEKVRGIDDSPLVEEYEAKSVGEQETFEKDTSDASFIIGRLAEMSQSVTQSLKDEGFKGFRTIAVTVRFADFETLSRAHTLTAPADKAETLQFEAMKLLMPFLDSRGNPKKKLIRLIGVRAEKLS